MVLSYIEIVLHVSSIGLVIIAAGLWAGAGIDSRPKYRDEQTLVGGTIWSQIIVPIGLMISKIVEENIDVYVEGFYLTIGILLLLGTGIVLIEHELDCFRRNRNRPPPSSPPPSPTSQRPRTTRSGASIKRQKYDKVYYAIGIICFIASMLKIAELVMVITQ